MLPNTPTYQPTAGAILNRSLLAIGGRSSLSQEAIIQQKVFAYSSTAKSWVYVSDLPRPMAATTVAVISPLEILVIGGWDGEHLQTVVKGVVQF